MTIPDENPASTAPVRRSSWLRFSLRTLMIVVTLVCVGIAGKLKYDWYRQKSLVAQWVSPIAFPADKAQRDGYGDLDIPAKPAGVEADEEAELLRLGILELDTPQERYSALAILIDSRPGDAVPILRRIVGQCRHPEEQAMLLHVISLLRDPEDIARIEPFLDSKSPLVRAAAAESLGYIHQPSYAFAHGFQFWGSRARLNTTPPVNVSSLISTGRPFAEDVDFEALEEARRQRIPATLRDRLEEMMLEGETTEERTAAARALVAWPPEKYELRLAEWGVWIDEGDKLLLARSVLEENPPFVHGTGNPVASLARNRYEGVIVVTRPIIHLTADRPLAIDLEVSITHGRPWYAFPRPDQFTVHGGGFASGLDLSETDLKPFDPQEFPMLEGMSEGYPWIHPDDRSSEASLGRYSPNYDIRSIGLRWQSLIVSPAREAWMTPPEVPKIDRYRWWRLLREVPSSWVVSQGETERFLYYDGPTKARSPVVAHLRPTELTVSSQTMFGEPRDPDWEIWRKAGEIGRPYAERNCLFIVSTGAQARAFHFPIASGPEVIPAMRLAEQKWRHGEDAEEALRKIVRDRGLSAEETEGLLSAWRDRLFDAPGQRLVTILAPEDYSRLCPLEIRPPATETARVGLILKEF